VAVSHLRGGIPGGFTQVTTAKIASFAASIAFFVVATRVLPMWAVGVASISSLYSFVATVAASLSVDRALTKRASEGVDPRVLSATALLASPVLALLAAVIAFLLLSQERLVGVSLPLEDAVLVSISSALYLFTLSGNSILFGLMDYRDASLVLGVHGVLSGLLKAVGSFAGLRGVFAGMALASAASSSLSWWLCLRRARPSSPSRWLLADMLRYSLPLHPSSVARLLRDNVDRILVQMIAGPEALGLYAVAASVTRPLRVLGDSAAQVLFPALSRVEAGRGSAEVSRLMGPSIRYSLMVVAPLSFLIAGLSRPILTLMAPEAYAEGYPILTLYSLSMMLYSPLSVEIAALMAVERTWSVSASFFSSLASGTAASALMIWGVGLIGGPVGYALGCIVGILTAKALLGEASSSPPWGRLARDMAAFSAAGLSSFCAVQAAPDPLSIPVGLAVWAAALAIGIRILRALDERDVSLIERAVPRPLAPALRRALVLLSGISEARGEVIP